MFKKKKLKLILSLKLNINFFYKLSSSLREPKVETFSA